MRTTFLLALLPLMAATALVIARTSSTPSLGVETAAQPSGLAIAPASVTPTGTGVATIPPVTPTPTGPAVDVEVRAFPIDGDPWLLHPNPSSLGVAFTAYQANKVGILTYGLPASSLVEFDLSSPAAGPWDIAWFGQELWFTEEQANKIARLNPTSGELVEFDIPTADAMPRGIDALEQVWFTEFQGQKIGRIDPANDFLMTEFWPDPNCSTLQGPVDIRETSAVWFTDSAGNRIGELWRDLYTGNWYFSFWNAPTLSATPWGIDVVPVDRVWFAESTGRHVARLNPVSPDLTCKAQFRDSYSATSSTLERQESERRFDAHKRRAGLLPVRALQTGDFIEYDVPTSVGSPRPRYLDVMESPPDAYNSQLFVGSVWFTDADSSPRAVGLLLPTSAAQGERAAIEPPVTELWGLAIQDMGSPVVWFTAKRDQQGMIGLILPQGIDLPTLTPTPTPSPTPTATPSPTPTPTLRLTPTPTGTLTPTPSPTPTPTSTPTLRLTPTPMGTPTPTPSHTPTPTSTPTLRLTPIPTIGVTPIPIGDVNCSGRANSVDAALVLQLIARLIAALDCQGGGDVNRDGAINAVDATLILQYDSGLIHSLPP